MGLNRGDIKSWFESAKAGDQIIYHEGSTLTKIRGKPYVSSGVLALRELYDDGRVAFVQRRGGEHGRGRFDSEFEYVAIKLLRRASIRWEDTFAFIGATSEALALDRA